MTIEERSREEVCPRTHTHTHTHTLAHEYVLRVNERSYEKDRVGRRS